MAVQRDDPYGPFNFRVTITPGTNQEGVAEHAFALIFALAKRVMTQHIAARAGSWPRQPNLPLRGQTLGLVGLGRIGNEQQHHVRFGNDLEHFPQGAIRFGKSSLARLLHRGTARPEAHFDPNPCAFERFAQILRLGWSLRAPADDPDLLDALERPG